MFVGTGVLVNVVDLDKEMCLDGWRPKTYIKVQKRANSQDFL